MNTAVWIGGVAVAIQVGTSVLYPTLGEIIGQRGGLVNLGIEGVMLMSAAVGYAVTVVTGNIVLGVLAGVAAGAAFNMLFGVLVVSRRTNQLASGLALYFLGAGLSALIGAAYIGERIEGLPKLGFPGLSSLPDPWGRLFEQDILVWLVGPIAVGLWWILSRSRWGLKVRATGEDRNSAYAAGLRPSRLQFQALALAGCLSGFGGAELALGYTKTFQEFMTAGRGFIAIMIVIFSLWHPLRAAGGAFLFGAATAIGLQLQAQGASVSPYLLDMLPYLVTFVVVLIWGRPKAFAAPMGLREVFQGTAK
jgi:simple sugar transport system permease protein